MSWWDDLLDWAGGGSDVNDALSGTDVSIEDIVGGTDGLFETGGGDGLDTSMGGGDSGEYQSNNGQPMYGLDAEIAKDNDSKEILVKDDNSYQSNNGEPMYGVDVSDKLSTGKKTGLIDGAADFIDKNKKLTDIGLGFVKEAYKEREAKKAESKAYERMLEQRAYNEKIQKEKEDRADARRGGGGGSSALEMLAAKEAIDQANKAKFSASITGLKPTGLINKGKKLTYVGGKPVYTDNGSIT